MRENRKSKGRVGRGACTGRPGFTLVEMLVAIAITLIFGVMAAKTLSAGAGMWRDGHRRAYAYDTATVIFQQIQDDLSASKSQFWGTDTDAYDTRVKFWADRDALLDASNNVLARRSWMRFVRAIPDFSTNPAIRQAGTDPTATGFYNLVNGLQGNQIQPLEGMCEVAYAMGLGAGDATTLYRAVLAPIGRTTDAGGVALTADDAGMTFFNADGWANYTLASPVDTTNDPLSTDARLQAKALPLAQGVIYFGIRLWSQYTTTWDPSQAGYSAADEQTTPDPSVPYVWANSYTPANDTSVPPRGLGALYAWNSDRINISAGDTPQFAMTWLQPGFVPPQPTYATDPDVVTDNVFPRSIEVVVTVEPPSELSVANPLHIVGDVPAGSTADIIVLGNRPPLNTQWPYVKIDDEWIRISGIEGNVLHVAARGQRGTLTADHISGARVLVGYTFSRIFSNPAAREYWGQ